MHLYAVGNLCLLSRYGIGDCTPALSLKFVQVSDVYLKPTPQSPAAMAFLAVGTWLRVESWVLSWGAARLAVRVNMIVRLLWGSRGVRCQPVRLSSLI